MPSNKELISTLSPLERKVLPFLEKPIKDIQKSTGLDETSVIRALKFLENKKLVKLTFVKRRVIELGVNGAHYKKNNLPERKLLEALEKHNHISLEKASKVSGLSENEFKASLGALKRKAFIELANNKIILMAKKEEIVKKFPEERLLEDLPKEYDSLMPEEMYAFNSLKQRKEIVELIEKTDLHKELTNSGKDIQAEFLENSQANLVEEVTQEIIKAGGKNIIFRRYDIQAPVPKIHGGRRHIVNQAVEYAKNIWCDMGFQEIEGPLVDTAFWVFDALFTAQDHPVREMQDSFYIEGMEGELPQETLVKKVAFWVFDALFTAQDHPVREMQDSFYIEGMEGELPQETLVKKVKSAHEKGVEGSRGWNYEWNEKEAQRVVLRTHTTSISARKLAQVDKTNLKFFTIGKVFRNETIDWSHSIEFYQTEGIVVNNDATLRHLFGYLNEFYNKMGFKKIRFRPSYFPYTEPSVEIDVYHPERQQWLELGGAGILRPEVTTPLLGKPIPVLAWGQGLDRIIMDIAKIKDLREMYENNLKNTRQKTIWLPKK